MQFALFIPALLLLLLGPGPSATIPRRARPVLLPDIPSAPLRIATDDDVRITIEPHNVVFLERTYLPLDEVLPALKARLGGLRSPRVVVYVDQSCPFGSVRSLLLVLRSAGISSVFLASSEASAVLPLPHGAT